MDAAKNNEQTAAATQQRKLTRASLDNLLHTRERIMRGRRFPTDSTEILRQSREERYSDGSHPPA